jgi:hypothetical protein
VVHARSLVLQVHDPDWRSAKTICALTCFSNLGFEALNSVLFVSAHLVGKRSMILLSSSGQRDEDVEPWQEIMEAAIGAPRGGIPVSHNPVTVVSREGTSYAINILVHSAALHFTSAAAHLCAIAAALPRPSRCRRSPATCKGRLT